MADIVIGVDCATQPRKVGLARAVRNGSLFEVRDALLCGKEKPLEVVLDWISSEDSTLLALDAPLGWPAALGRSLSSHQAGEAIRVPDEILFRRHTDRVVAERTGKVPLDVGADRIARTAHWTLLFLDHLRRELDERIPLAWSVPLQTRVEAIEVYPAATLLGCGASIRGYKKASGRVEREAIFQSVEQLLDCSTARKAMLSSADVLDAVVCALAGVDFLEGKAFQPTQPDLARDEGWIWFRELNEAG